MSDDPLEIRRQIEATRAELGDTVAALAVKADVKTQARERSEELRQKAIAKRDELLVRVRGSSPDGVTRASQSVAERVRANPLPVAIAAALLAGLVVGRLTSR